MFLAMMWAIDWHVQLDRLSTADWVIIVAYFAASALALRTAWPELAMWSSRRRGSAAEPARSTVPEPFPWVLAAVVMVALGLNKLLGTQEWILDHLRRDASSGGWYGSRRRYQAIVVAVIGAIGVVVTIMVARRLKGLSREAKSAVLALGLLVIYVAIRGVSLHQIDGVLKQGAFHVRFVIELIGISAVAFCCVLGGRRDVRDPATETENSTLARR